MQRFTRQILTALVTLEDANIIHCDLKPENILLVPSSPKQSVAPASESSRSLNRSEMVGPSDLSWFNKSGNSPFSASISKKISSSNTSCKSSGDTSLSESGPVRVRGDSVAEGAPRVGNERKSGQISDVKVIDFGSACMEGSTMYSYIQSRFCKSSYFFLVFISNFVFFT